MLTLDLELGKTLLASLREGMRERERERGGGGGGYSKKNPLLTCRDMTM